MIQEKTETGFSPQKLTVLTNSPILILFSTVLLAGLIHLSLNSLFGNRAWVHEPIHSSIEASGALIALILAPLILIQKIRSQEKSFCIWISSSLVALGIFDLIHAFLPIGPIFYLSRAVGTFMAGGILSLVWLNPSRLKPLIMDRLPWITAFIASAIGMILWYLVLTQPPTVELTRFYGAATAILNNLGSIGFLAAAAYFLYGIPKQEAQANHAFAQFCLLFAVSGILFFFGNRWSVEWWFFHFLRLSAYFTMIVYLTSSFRQSLKLARQTNADLEKEITGRTLQLAIANRNLQTEVADRSSSEAELQRIRNQLEATLQAVKDQVIVFDMKGKVAFINHFDEHYDTLVPGSALTKDLSYFTERFELFDSENQILPFARWPVCRVLRGETVTSADYKLHYQGQDIEYYMHYSGEPVFDENGKQILAVIVVRDITELKKSELRLRESEARFRQLADFMPQIIWSSSADGRTEYYNKRWFDYTGQDPSSNPSEVNWISVMHPDDIPHCMQKWEASKKSGEPFQAECRLKQQDGQYRWHLSRALHLSPTPESAERWFGTSTDIHDHKTLLENIKESQERLSLATAAAEIETWTINLVTGELHSYGDRSDILGLDHSEIVGLDTFRNRIHPDDLAPAQAAFDRAVKDQVDYITEYRIQHKDGRYRWVFARGRPVFDSNGQPLRMYGVSMDITDRKTMEDQLKEALNKANEANKLKSAFLANMSHEIRTPLGAILGFTDLLREDSLTHEERDHFFDVISRNGEQLSTLINDILDLSKVESGNFHIEILKTDFRNILQEVISIHEIKAQKKKLQLNFRVEDNVPLCIGTDPTRLKQILTNLVGNAVKFTSAGFVHVHAMMGDASSLRVQIQDSGVGLTDSEREKLFQPFSQADSSTTRKFGGTGLGLVLSRKLAKALGGDLSILSSQPGVGTIFEVQIENHLYAETPERAALPAAESPARTTH